MTYAAGHETSDALQASAANDIRNAQAHLTGWAEDPGHSIRHLTAAVRHVALAIAAMGDEPGAQGFHTGS